MDRCIKNVKFVLPLLIASCFFSSQSQAEPWVDLSRFDVYVGAGASVIGVEAVDLFEKDVDFKAGEVLGGIRWRWIGVEARHGVSLNDETVNLGPDAEGINRFAETGIDSYNSIYLRLQFENDIAAIYGLYGETEISTSSTIESAGGSTIILSEASGTSYGLGAGIRINDNLFFNVEIKNLIDSDTDTFTQTGFGVDFRFW